MAYDFERVQLEFRDVCRKAGATSGLKVPIKLNGRLTRTLGRVTYHTVDGECTSTLVEFSKQFIETSTDKSIRDVILHEAAHLIAIDRTGEAHGHDSYFKSICAEIGTSNDGVFTKVERTVAEESLYKYVVRCNTCKKNIGYYNRMCNTLKYLDRCTCNICKTSNLTMKQNW